MQENTMFQKLDLVVSSGERGRHLLCWVPWKELTFITGWKHPFSETLHVPAFRIPDDGNCPETHYFLST
jgi:hypothetical protein